MSITATIIFLFAFAWSGFVRTGLGFGGTALMLPFVLLAVNTPLEIVPLITLQSILFSSIPIIKNHKNINYSILFKMILIMIIPVAVGLFGLVTFPDYTLMMIVYAITGVYAITYIYPIKLNINARWIDTGLLILGGYMMGVAYTGSPAIVAVAMRYLPKYQLRDTLFALWVIIAIAKLISLYWLNVNLNLDMQLWLLPAVFVGHFLGLHFHKKILTWDERKFYTLLGSILLLVILIGIIKLNCSM